MNDTTPEPDSLFAGPWEDDADVQSKAEGLRYELLRVVNRGGMGEIALGRVHGTKGFEKLVVLKRLRADAEREDHIEMFDVEQEVMSRIEHPNIVKVFDQPVIDRIPYLAMEYIRGRNLDQIVRSAYQGGQRLSLQFSLTVLLEVLRGLAFVHRLKDSEGNALGVVHQDMTPSNVLVSFYGEVKITDFGISYVTSRDGGLRKGVLKGKPRYVAPEVLAGKRVNNTADIYGVGVVLYELLTGQALFARRTVKETLTAVARNELPDFHRAVGEYGEGVVRILETTLKKDPKERYRTAESMAADILNELTRIGGPMPPANVAHVLRTLFKGDSDVPEMDPAFEEAIQRGLEPAQIKPADLDETLSEIDRLLGHDDSHDLFAVPPDIQSSLADMNDMDPFLAETPLPSFMWEAKSDAERLAAANAAYDDDFVRQEPDLWSDSGTAKPRLTKPDDPLPFAPLSNPPGSADPLPGTTAPDLNPPSRTDSTPAASPKTPAQTPARDTLEAPSQAMPPAREGPRVASLPPAPSAGAEPPSFRPVIERQRPAAPVPPAQSPMNFWLGLGIGALLGAGLLFVVLKVLS